MANIKEIGHAVMYVTDVDISAQWYCDVLGMEVVTSSERTQGKFLSFGRKDHDLALFQSSDVARHGRREYNHLAFELDGDLDDLRSFRRRLVDRDIPITGTVDHGISYGIYFLDPDGHQLEVFLPRTGAAGDSKAAMIEIGPKSEPIDLDTVES